MQLMILQLAMQDAHDRLKWKKGPQPHLFAPILFNRSAVTLMLPYVHGVLLPQARWHHYYQDAISDELHDRCDQDLPSP